MAESITNVKRRVVRRLLVELDDTGKYTLDGDVVLAGMFRTDSPWIVRLAEQALAEPKTNT